jgi:hypothetical protein
MGDLAIDKRIILTSTLQKTCRRLHASFSASQQVPQAVLRTQYWTMGSVKAGNFSTA